MNEARTWLSSLDEDALRSLLTWHQCLRGDKHPHGPGRSVRRTPPSRRELTAARVRIAKASPHQLNGVLVCGLFWTVQALRDEHGFDERTLAAPTLDELRTMLKVLDPPLARCALYGMLVPETRDLPAAALARAHKAALQEAADGLVPAGYSGPPYGDPRPWPVVAPAPTHPEGEEPDPVPSPAAGPEAGLPTDIDPTDLPGALAGLKRAGERLAEDLRSAAGDVAAGRRPQTDPVGRFGAWAACRERLAEALAAQGIAWEPGHGHAEAEAELDRVRSGQIDGLRRKAGKYAELLELADDEEEAAHLHSQLDRIEAQLRALGALGLAPEASAETRPGAVADDAEPVRVPTQVPVAVPAHLPPPVPAVERTPASVEPDTLYETETETETGTGTGTGTGLGPEDPEAAPTAPEPPAGPTGRGTGDAAPARFAAGVSAIEAVRRAVEPPAAVSLPLAAAPSAPAPSGPVERTGAPDAAGPAGSDRPAAADEPDDRWPDGVEAPDWDPYAPWDTGAESPVSRLLRDGRIAEAYWMTVASREDGVRAATLAFAAAAFDCVSDSEATPVQMAHEFDPAVVSQDREAHLVALAAALRTGFTTRWPHALVSGFTMPPGLTAPWQHLLEVLVAAVRDGRAFEPGMLQDSAEDKEVATREEIGLTARQLLDDLPRRKMKYQRASQVLQHLLGPSGTVRHALQDVIEWAGKSADQHTGAPRFQELERLWRQDGIARLIEDTDALFRTSKQAKEPITAGALRQLHTACRSVGELVMRAAAVQAAARPHQGVSERGVPELASALRGLAAEPVPAGPGGGALALLLGWLTGGDRDRRRRADGTAVDAGATADRLREDGGRVPSADCLLRLPDLPRHDNGEPDLSHPRVARRMAALLTPADGEYAFARYLDEGELDLATALAALIAKDPDGYGCTDPEWAESAARLLAQAHEDWRRTVAERHRAAAGLLAQMRTLNQLAPDEERDFVGRLQQYADGGGDGRYRLAVESLRELEAELVRRVENYTRQLREDLARLRSRTGRPLAAADHDRIERLIDEGDTVTAQEFLALATGHNPLPERPADDGSELAAFLAGVAALGAPKAGGEGVDADWWARHYGGPEATFTRLADNALEAWAALCTPQGRSNGWKQHLSRVLRLLGLDPSQEQVVAEKMALGQGMRRFKVRAKVAERAGYVAALGSRATSYTVLLIWEEQPADGPLAHLEEADVGANIVLYLHPLGLEGRRGLAESARSSAQQALVVDAAVMGWMAARAPGAFRSLQRVTLPWAAYNPYTPFVAGLVPPEVFYGRDEEMREVMSPDGGMFLYGGRQLGKSALLRRVAEIFPSRSAAHVAVYLDLLKAEIGHAEAPERIWSRLVEDLKRKGVLARKVSEQANPDVVFNNIQSWLEEDETRRILVLADEADAFLNTDSRRAFRVGSESTFPNVARFQRLMEQTGRRFKIVFAGLHQVQRFGHLSNVSTVHGGPDVLVGPLGTQAAVRLVTEPMAALGHFFERPELVWRILAITNYQANLVQIFCRELVRVLHDRPYSISGGPDGPARITEQDVQQVAASETVRRQIAERLRFTINLEDRYRVLALVIALRSLEDGYRADYSASELLEEARAAWSDGFEMLSARQVQIFLTEMVGLGLLVQLGDRSRFAVRSPNVVNMLGTREELELELSETEFGLPYDYNPRVARRILGRDARHVQTYSPLTEEQLHETAQPGVSLIGTTALHRPELVGRAVTAFAENRGVEVVAYRHGEDLTGLLKSRGRKAHVITADLRGASQEQLGDAVRSMLVHAGPAADRLVSQTGPRSGGNENRSVVVVADATTLARLAAEDRNEELAVRWLRPRRWTADALRAWSECPFVSREDRDRIVAATGGWPRWMEIAVTDVSVHGATLDNCVERIRDLIAGPRNIDEHLRCSGLDPRDLRLLAAWTGYVEEGQGVPRDDVEAAVELSEEETGAWLGHLDQLGVLDETPDGFAVEPVTYRSVRAWAVTEGS
ncbi:hypothetical protein ACFYU9_31640 [Streptomyces sp. NPDC004327]|uniref:hypothetical protein n=1 Tax=Streptomyces sp. NPDC004327 TaxID=3364699 RepID=UPI0036BD0A52